MSREGLIPQLQAHSIQVTALKYGYQSISVYQGTYQGNAAVIKVMAMSPGTDYTQLERECQLLKSHSHPHILELYDCFWEHTGACFFYVIVTEWCENDLAKDMQQRALGNGYWKEEELLELTYELVSALVYMQEQGISHRDIKPESVFLTPAKSAKLGNFGSIHNFQSDIETCTPYYLSPKLREAAVNQTPQVVHNSFKSDVFSLGLTLLSLIRLAPPQFLSKTHLSNEEITAEISTVPFSVKFKSMLASMLSVDEDLRCDFKTLKEWKIQKSKEPSDAGCMQCGKIVDRFSETAMCEVVQLYCDPWKHMFCSRDCFKTFLSFGTFKCPKCDTEIPDETVTCYLQDKLLSADYRHLNQPRPFPGAVTDPPETEETKRLSSEVTDATTLNPTTELLCLQCKSRVDRYSPTASCEVVQLYCDPSHHMFCSNECCKAYLNSGSFQCPKCDACIPDETILFYLSDQRQEVTNSIEVSANGRREPIRTLEHSQLREEKEPFCACNCCADTCSCW